MIMKQFLYTFTSVCILFLISCNEILVEIGDSPIPETDRVVLLEELTGASCPNCPKGSAAVEAILQKYKDKVAAIAIHGDFLAQPVDGRSKYDFRNPKAKDLENWFKPFLGKPCATVNRIELNDPDQKYATVSTGLWQSMIEKELSKPNQLSLIMNNDYDPDTRIINIDITAIPVADLDGSYNISIFLTESGITDAQINGNVIVDDYVHNHVLRDIITRFDGDFFGSDMKQGTRIKKNYTYTLPDNKDGLWNADKMDIVIAIHKSGGTDRTIIQATQSKVIK